jgi:hypothetical protein
MQRDEDVPFLVSSGVWVCGRLRCIAWLENGLMDVVTRVYGHSMFAEFRWDMDLGCYPLGQPGGNGSVTLQLLARSCSARFLNSFSAGVGEIDQNEL